MVVVVLTHLFRLTLWYLHVFFDWHCVEYLFHVAYTLDRWYLCFCYCQTKKFPVLWVAGTSTTRKLQATFCSSKPTSIKVWPSLRGVGNAMLGFVLIQSKLNSKRRNPWKCWLQGLSLDISWSFKFESQMHCLYIYCTIWISWLFFSNLFTEMVMTKTKRKALY